MRFERFMLRARTTTPAVVIGVFDPTGLGVVRNLAREGVPVLALDADPRSAGLLSRHAAHGVCPDPHYHEDEFIATLVEIGRRLPRKAVLFPCQDDLAFVTSRRAEELEPYYLLPFSRWEAMRRLANKEEQMRAAHAAGVDTPRTAFLHSREDLERAVHDIPFPAVLKSADHLAMRRRHFGKVVRVESAADLPAAYARVEECGDLLLQEIIPGGDEEYWYLGSYLDGRSRPLALFTGRRLRQYPRGFGNTRSAESLWAPHVAEAGLQLLRQFDFHGVSHVEFKRDPRDGRLKLMEVNARHYGTHALATASGVNLSAAAYDDAVGRPRPPATRQRDGVRWIVVSRDVKYSLREIARGELSAREWVSSLKGTRVDGMLSWDDPVPGVYEFARTLFRGLDRRARQALGASGAEG